ncbi:MAG: excinuclease ABC subunit UvrC [Thermodesulfobacteriota bacterium]
MLIGPPSSERTSLLPLIERAARAPGTPGVYLMKEGTGQVIYVGKALNLKKRLSSYFSPSLKPDLKTASLISRIRDFEIIMTSTENEALILESTLIKRFRPRYNIFLKDDKRYPSLRLNLQEPFPSLEIVRKIENDGSVYFGPFSSAKAVRETLRMAQKIFKLRRCRSGSFRKNSRPCLNLQMGLCIGPCTGSLSESRYGEVVKEVILFLKGRTPHLISKIRNEMIEAADREDYEHAALLRDKLFSLERTLEKQVSVMPDFLDRDVFAVAGDSESSVVTLLGIRGGFLMSTRHFEWNETLSTKPETLGSFIRQYYEKGYDIPDEILLSTEIEEKDLISEWLTQKKKKRVRILLPCRGQKLVLAGMADQNAKQHLEEIRVRNLSGIQQLNRLQQRLSLTRFPALIECIDNSTLSGSQSVACFVVFENSNPKPSGYRKYNLENIHAPDDYAFMGEALKRRFSKQSDARYPDLLMVDGGKGHLNVASARIRELGLSGKMDLISIAKKDPERREILDKIYLPGRADPVHFGPDRDLLFLLQRIRNEAHRFAVEFHRKKRKEDLLTSVLDSVPGIGSKRKKGLLRHFGSIEGIRRATLDDLSGLPGMTRTAAQAVRDHLLKSEESREPA